MSGKQLKTYRCLNMTTYRLKLNIYYMLFFEELLSVKMTELTETVSITLAFITVSELLL